MVRAFLKQLRRLMGSPASGQPGGVGRPQINYSLDLPPRASGRALGGMVKLYWLDEIWPNSRTDFNLLYTVSSTLQPDWPALCWAAKRRGADLVLNQNGTYYPGCCSGNLAKANRLIKKAIEQADYIFYQSEFCKRSADKWVARPACDWEVLYNAVDTDLFKPLTLSRTDRPVTLLLGGTQYARYRVETALACLARLHRTEPKARLIITGRIIWPGLTRPGPEEVTALAREMGLIDHIELTGPYAPLEAPSVFNRADVLLHTKYNDPCPGLVLEAMACGLPVVYSASGGTSELVGPEAGVGVAAETSWEKTIPPDPDQLAEAVLTVLEDRPSYAEAARQRAVDKFNIKQWLDRHRQVFERLVSR